METCIQRYKARRKFDAFRINIFNSYLRLGGVQTGQKQYSGGIDPKKMDDLDAEQIGLLAATDFITFNDNGGDDAQEYDVDFAFVVRGFLSYKVPYGLGIRKVPELEMACQVVRNFLNYVSVSYIDSSNYYLLESNAGYLPQRLSGVYRQYQRSNRTLQPCRKGVGSLHTRVKPSAGLMEHGLLHHLWRILCWYFRP